MDRRSFLETSGLLTVAVASVPLGTLLAGCSTIPERNAEIMGDMAVVPKDVFMVDGKRSPVVVLRVPGKKTPIALVSEREDEVKCFLMLCTHKKCEVTAQQGQFVCHCHGSEFDQSGAVMKGPAKESLLEIPVSTDGLVYGIPLAKW